MATNNEFEKSNEIVEMMEFEEMQVIWNNQNNEKLYAINESALYQSIKNKGKVVNRWLHQFEIILVSVNILVAAFLTIVAYINDSETIQYLLAAIYLGYAILSVFWWRRRKQEDVQFEKTMLGEIDKAIWQLNYIIKRTRQLIIWYLIPLGLFMVGMTLYQGQPWLALALVIVMGGAGFATDRWEVKRHYLPKKKSLEALRKTLVAAEE